MFYSKMEVEPIWLSKEISFLHCWNMGRMRDALQFCIFVNDFASLCTFFFLWFHIYFRSIKLKYFKFISAYWVQLFSRFILTSRRICTGTYIYLSCANFFVLFNVPYIICYNFEAVILRVRGVPKLIVH